MGVSVLSGGTDVHLVLVDLRNSELDGQQAEDRLHELGITVNRNAIPNDPRSPDGHLGPADRHSRHWPPAASAPRTSRRSRRSSRPPSSPSYDADDLKARVAALAEKFPLYPGLK
ncbi:serine hydroxymethyltransferase [Streptomyces hirsutus]